MRRQILMTSASMAIAVMAAPVQADVITGNFSAGVAPAGTIFGINTTSIFKAVGWTMGPEDYELDAAVLTMEFLGARAIVSIWEGSELRPGSRLMTLESPAQVGTGDFAFTPPSTLILEAGKHYWLYVESEPNPTAQFRWNGTTPSTVPTGIATTLGFNFNGNASTTRNRFEIRGSPAAEPCYANCDGSTTEPILTVDDFTCFINEFAAAQALPVQQQIEHYANCDGSTTEPILTVDDFTCFINAFAQGCP